MAPVRSIDNIESKDFSECWPGLLSSILDVSEDFARKTLAKAVSSIHKFPASTLQTWPGITGRRAKSATCILRAITWICVQHVFRHVARIVGVCATRKVKAFDDVQAIPESKIPRAARSRRFCDCTSRRLDGISEAVRCNEDALCMHRLSAGMNDLRARCNNLPASMNDMPALTHASSQMPMRCARAIERRDPPRTNDRGAFWGTGRRYD